MSFVYQPIGTQKQLTRFVALSLVITQLIPTSFAARVPGLPNFTIDALKTAQVIVVFEDTVAPWQQQEIMSLGGEIRRSFDLIPAVTVKLPAPALAALQQLPGVAAIHEDMQVFASLQQSVPLIGGQMVRAIGKNGNGAKVCVVDTGVQANHPALGNVIAQHDFVEDDTNAADGNGHGTHVAGIISSKDAVNGGVAPGAKLLVARVLDENGTGYTSDVIAGLEWCRAQGAQIVNMSLGGGTYVSACDSEPLAAASNTLVDQGVTVIAASGNNGRPDRISAPACASKVISVGAVDKSDKLASYSNGGSQLDISAPGSSIRSTYLNSAFSTLTGTSMATPHVAGVAALILGERPGLKPAEVREILQSTAKDLGSTGFDTSFGFGRVDAAAAIQKAMLEPAEPGPAPTAILEEPFTTLTAWTQNNAGWLARKAAERAVPSSSSDNFVAHGGNCPAPAGCTLMSQPMNLSALSAAELHVWRFVDKSIDEGEGLRIEVGDGTNWEVLASFTDGQGNDDIWHREVLPIPPNWLKSNARVRFWSKIDSIIEEVEVDDARLITFTTTNGPPLADAGPDQTVTDGNSDGQVSITLNGAGSSDDTQITKFVWTESGSTLGEGATLSHLFSLGWHKVKLLVTDDDELEASDETIVTILPNVPPVANAGADQMLTDEDGDGRISFLLDGGASTDSDGTIASYAWTFDGALLASGSVLSITAALGTHEITLTVRDNGGATSTDTVIISSTPEDPQPPVADAGNDQTATDNDGDGKESVQLDGTKSIDPDGTDLTYAWSTSGTLLWTGSTLTATMPIGSFVFDLVVTDGNGQTGSDSMTVTVLPNTPPTANAGTDQTLVDTNDSGDEQVALDGSRSTDSGGTIAAYKWILGETVLGNAMNIQTVLPVGTHVITLEVTDNGNATAQDTVTMIIAPAPVAPGTPKQIFKDAFTDSGLGQWSNVGFKVQRPGERAVTGSPIGNQVAHAERCNEACSLTLGKAIDLTSYASAVLRFWRFVDKSFDTDEFMKLELHDGSTWQTVRTWSKNSGADDTWQQETIDLTPYLHALFQLRFVSRSSSLVEEAEVDDVIIEGHTK